MTKDWAEERMLAGLQQREEKGTLRSLPAQYQQAAAPHHSSSSSAATIDFSSNDYLGLAQSLTQAKRVEELFDAEHQQKLLGATGSRLLSGDSPVFHQLEAYLARLHEKPAALLCNSGYDANLSLVSSLPCDVILYDEYAHNSLHMAMRFWQTRDETRRTMMVFGHNSTRDLQAKLRRQVQQQQQNTTTPTVVVIVESVYSMDGDCAPLAEILDHAASYGARVVVDEAHGLGISGPTGLLSALGLHQHPALLSAVYTFGKAAGCHGAVITGSHTLRAYLTNFGYPFIYSTAMPLHSLCTIRASYETMTGARGDALRAHLVGLIELFQTEMTQQILSHHWQQQWNTSNDVSLIPSTTAIQALVVPGNQRCSAFCQTLWHRSHHRIRLFPIRSPTVPAGMERVRIVLHAHNSIEQVRELIQLVCVCLREHPPEDTVRSKL